LFASRKIIPTLLNQNSVGFHSSSQQYFSTEMAWRCSGSSNKELINNLYKVSSCLTDVFFSVALFTYPNVPQAFF